MRHAATAAAATSAEHARSADTATSAGSAESAANARNAAHAGSADTATRAAAAGSADVAAALTPGEPVHLVGESGEPPFEGSWTNGTGAPVGFFRDKEGIVHLQGDPKGGVSGTAVFKLPEGYRPSAFLFMPAMDHGLTKLASLRVQPDGEAVMFCAGGCPGSSIGIDGLSFRAG